MRRGGNYRSFNSKRGKAKVYAPAFGGPAPAPVKSTNSDIAWADQYHYGTVAWQTPEPPKEPPREEPKVEMEFAREEEEKVEEPQKRKKKPAKVKYAKKKVVYVRKDRIKNEAKQEENADAKGETH